MIDYRVGDSRAVVAGIADGTVDLIASSPPFLALRSYLPAGHESKGDEIGSEANPAAFLDTLLELTAEWGRVLAPHGSIAIELGDSFSGSGGAGGDYNEGGLRDGQNAFVGSSSAERRTTETKRTRIQYDGHAQPIRDLHGKTQGGGTGWPLAKSLALIPELYRVALAYGINPLTGQPSPAGRWRVRNVIVWHRPNPAVGALGDKFRPSTSYIVVATRSAKRWFDLTAVRGAVKQDYKPHDADMAKREATVGINGYGHMQQVIASNPAGAPPLDAWFDAYDGSHDTWTLTTQPSKLAHYAMWPAKLAERLILSMCPLEVCRVCGEPRRRLEGKAEYERTDSNVVPARLAQSNGHRLARGVNQHHNDIGANTSVIRSAPTLGWTRCDCRLRYLSPGETSYRPGVVLDPFAGTGTTLAVADLHGRDAIGIDLDPRNKLLYERRREECHRALFGTQPEMPGQLSLM